MIWLACFSDNYLKNEDWFDHFNPCILFLGQMGYLEVVGK